MLAVLLRRERSEIRHNSDAPIRCRISEEGSREFATELEFQLSDCTYSDRHCDRVETIEERRVACVEVVVKSWSFPSAKDLSRSRVGKLKGKRYFNFIKWLCIFDGGIFYFTMDPLLR